MGWFRENSYNQLAKKYFEDGFGSVFTFSLKEGYDAAVKLVENCNLISHLANVGDTKTLIVHPASTTHRQLNKEQKEKSGISDAMIRLSIGLENHKDIVEDLRGALKYRFFTSRSKKVLLSRNALIPSCASISIMLIAITSKIIISII